MKPFVFNKDSWHYWLATEVGSFNKYHTGTDICTYTRAVLTGAFWFTVAVAAILGLTYWATITVVWWVVVLQYGFFAPDGPIILTSILTIFGTAGAIANGVPWLYQKAKRKLYDRRQGRRDERITQQLIVRGHIEEE